VALKDIRQTVSFDSSGVSCCEECDFTSAEIDALINHYLEHGYELLHVGQQTSRDGDGNLWQRTVVVLGK